MFQLVFDSRFTPQQANAELEFLTRNYRDLPADLRILWLIEESRAEVATSTLKIGEVQPLGRLRAVASSGLAQLRLWVITSLVEKCSGIPTK
jgi:hypothetical protein